MFSGRLVNYFEFRDILSNFRLDFEKNKIIARFKGYNIKIEYCKKNCNRTDLKEFIKILNCKKFVGIRVFKVPTNGLYVLRVAPLEYGEDSEGYEELRKISVFTDGFVIENA